MDTTKHLKCSGKLFGTPYGDVCYTYSQVETDNAIQESCTVFLWPDGQFDLATHCYQLGTTDSVWMVAECGWISVEHQIGMCNQLRSRTASLMKEASNRVVSPSHYSSNGRKL